MSTQKSLDKTALSVKILEKAEEYQDRLSTELVKYQTLLKLFETVTTVWDMNLLYEEYFGIMVPAFQSAEMGTQDENGARIFYDDDGNKMWDINNPRFGNKLNF